MKLFVPAVGYRIQLTSDWSFTLYGESRNKSLFEMSGFDYDDFSGGWRDTMKHTPVTLPVGTLLEVDRVYVRTINKTAQSDADDFDSVTFRVISHPASWKRTPRFWAKLSDVNNIEYELPVDHTAGKDNARENAKKPKKLTPQIICKLVNNAIQSVLVSQKNYSKLWGDIPGWMTKDVIKQFKQIALEYKEICEPILRADYEREKAKELATVEKQLATGQISVPIGLHDKVKTVDDLRRFSLYYFRYEAPFEMRNHTFDYFISYKVMYQYNSTPSTFEKLSDGTKCRTFRPSPPHNNEPDVTHIWVKVYSNVEDNEIIRVEAGTDK
jgi:hypothetical protein